MTTFSEFVTRLSNLDITGVTKIYEFPPASLNTADLPAQWLMFPTDTQGALTFKNHGGWPTFTAVFVVAVEPVAQGTQSQNYTKAVEMVDNVDAALQDAVGTIVKGKIEWSGRVDNQFVGEHSYWVVITDVTAHG